MRLASVAFLSFLVGAFVVHHRDWPYPWLRRVFMAVTAARVQFRPADRFGPYFYHRARTTETGVRRHDRGRAYAGLTLFTSSHAQKAFLVTMDGEFVHEWHLPFSAAWPDPSHFDREPASDELIVWRKAALYPNGDLLAVYEGLGAPWGYGLAKLDKDSKLLWTYDAHVHHDVTIGPDGRIYTLTHEVVTDPIPGLAPRVAPPVIDDCIVVLSPEGGELDKLDFTSAIKGSSHASLLALVEPAPNGDLWHINAVEPLGQGFADHHERFEADQLLVSLRGPHTLAVVDMDRKQVVWASLGSWRGQHDADPLPNGNILLFDNHGHLGRGARSRVIEFDPFSLEIAWQYAGTDARPLDSYKRSSQQRLANGNTLITESFEGRILEVTPSGDVVWEFLSPFRARHDSQLVAYTHWAQRIDPQTFRVELASAR